MREIPTFVLYFVAAVNGVCLLACTAALVRYAIQVDPKELKVQTFATIFGVTVALLATLFFMWRV